MEVTPAGTGASVLHVSGSLTKVLHSAITSEDVARIRFTDCEYSLGLGALAGFVACATGLLYGVVRHHLRLRVAPDSRWRLQFTHDGVVAPVTPEEFSEQIALTSPIPLPKGKPRSTAAAEPRPEPSPVDDRSSLTGSRR